ncbi:MAG: flagellar motor switch protein FliN [Dehalococcoidia bacterium]
MADEQDEQGNASQDDIDALFAAHEAAGESADAPAGAPGAMINVSPDVATLLGDPAAVVLGGLAARAAEVLTVGIDSVAGQRAVLVDATLSVTDYAAVEAEFAAIDHMGFEVKVALSPSESHLAAVLVPLSDLGALLSIDLSTESLQDADFAKAQTDAVGGSMRQVLDLVSLTLFAEELQGVEATLSDLRIGQIEYTMGILGDVAQGAPAVRLHLALARTDGSVIAIQLIVPSTLLMALAERLDPAAGAVAAAPEPVEEPTPLRRPVASAAGGPGREEPRGFGLSDDPGNVSPLRPAGTFGANVGDDVDVFPVRFPPLPGVSQAGAQGPRSLDLIMDVSMRVTVELGRSTMTVEDVLALGPGSVIELNKLAGEPVDILVNDQLIARGEVVVVDENFGVRVTEIVSPRRRATAMGN